MVVVAFTVVVVAPLTVVVVAPLTVVAVVPLTVVDVAEAVEEAESLAHVAGPTMPSAFSPFLRWKAITAAEVCDPNLPSAEIEEPCAASAVWICLTPGPLSPSFTLSLGLETTRPVPAPAVVVAVPDDVVELVDRAVVLTAVELVAAVAVVGRVVDEPVVPTPKNVVVTGPPPIVVVVDFDFVALELHPASTTSTTPHAAERTAIRDMCRQ